MRIFGNPIISIPKINSKFMLNISMDVVIATGTIEQKYDYVSYLFLNVISWNKLKDRHVKTWMFKINTDLWYLKEIISSLDCGYIDLINGNIAMSFSESELYASEFQEN